MMLIAINIHHPRAVLVLFAAVLPAGMLAQVAKSAGLAEPSFAPAPNNPFPVGLNPPPQQTRTSTATARPASRLKTSAPIAPRCGWATATALSEKSRTLTNRGSAPVTLGLLP